MDPKSGAILAFEYADYSSRAVYEFTAKENQPIPDSAFWPLRAYLGRFSPLRLASIEGMIGMLVAAVLAGLALAGAARKLASRNRGSQPWTRSKVLVLGLKTTLALLVAIPVMWLPAIFLGLGLLWGFCCNASPL